MFKKSKTYQNLQREKRAILDLADEWNCLEKVLAGLSKKSGF